MGNHDSYSDSDGSTTLPALVPGLPGLPCLVSEGSEPRPNLVEVDSRALQLLQRLSARARARGPLGGIPKSVLGHHTMVRTLGRLQRDQGGFVVPLPLEPPGHRVDGGLLGVSDEVAAVTIASGHPHGVCRPPTGAFSGPDSVCLIAPVEGGGLRHPTTDQTVQVASTPAAGRLVARASHRPETRP